MQVMHVNKNKVFRARMANALAAPDGCAVDQICRLEGTEPVIFRRKKRPVIGLG